MAKAKKEVPEVDLATSNSARVALKEYIDRIEDRESQKAIVVEDIKEIYQEAKGTGFDTAALREIIKRRKEDREKREALEMVIETYERALEE